MRIERLRAGATEADLDAVAALESESFTNPWPRATLVWELENSDVTRAYLLKDDTGAVVAFCVCWVIFDELHINTLAVAPAARRRGIATAILRHVIAEAVGSGVTRATLEVRASNTAALGLYQRLGFHVAATRRGYYAKPAEDALILWREGLDASP
jgi:ribosomal-protein-alanine N-acetyltransferase